MTRTLLGLLILAPFCLCGCDKTPPAETKHAAVPDQKISSLGSIEVTARLVEIPEGAIFKRDLYDYAAILKYEVVSVQRGGIAPSSIIYVGHYNPWKPRSEAADRRTKGIGGNLREFQVNAIHHMALEPNMDEVYLGGIVDKYFGKRTEPALWAVWTNLVP